MPELPEVEAVRRALQPAMEGARFDKVLTRRPNLRAPFPRDFVSRLEGRTVRSLTRRGKYLVGELSSGDVLLMHLGMSGSFRVTFNAQYDLPSDSHDHVVFQMSSGATVTFNDPRRFGAMDLVLPDQLPHHRALSALGPEPLGADFDATILARACRNKKASLKAALSDQRIVAGLGNIYVCEALHRARLSPRRQASTIATRAGAPRDAAYRLAAAIGKVLTDAIRRSETAARRRPGSDDVAAYFPDRFRVYDREGERCCTPRCPGVVRRVVQQGRSTFYCPVCQR